MPLNQEQAQKLKNELWLVLDNNEPPMTVDERNGMNHQIDQIVNTYITAETPPPEPEPIPPPTGSGDYKELKWPAEGYTRVQTAAPCKLKFTVPAGWKNGSGRVQVSYATGAEQNFKSMVLSATPGGPPIAPWADIPESKTPPITWYLGPPPDDYYEPPLQPGATYYVTIDNNPAVAEGTNTAIWVDLYVP